MRIVLSRKGYDSANGGMPSPVFTGDREDWNGRMFSLPIPESDKNDNGQYENRNTGRQLKQLVFPNGFTPEISKPCIWDGKEAFVHLDPDIRKSVYKKCPKGWKPAYGQNVGFTTHIFTWQPFEDNPDDDILFLFYGLFRNYKKDGNVWRAYGKKYHAIWGYMLSEPKDIDDNVRAEYPWHPHCKDVFQEPDKIDNNTLFVPKGSLFKVNGKKYPTYGAFKFSEKLVLTKERKSASRWDEKALPWLNIGDDKPNMSYHTIDSFKDGYFQSAYPGQEFVVTIQHVEDDKNIMKWLGELLENIDYEWNDYEC